ncbi:MAG: hypothetical protein ABIE22_00215 [archaeon]
MKVELVKGYSIDQKDVDCVINSANGHLFLRTSGAGRIREISETIGGEDRKEYNGLLAQLPEKTRNWYEGIFEKEGYEYTQAQLSCLRLLVENGRAFELGDAVLDTNWSKSDPRAIIHAVGMSYSLGKEKVHRKRASVDSVGIALGKSFYIAREQGYESVAVPIMCSRKGYGLTPEKSHEILSDLLIHVEDSLNRVVICADNEETARLVKK